MSVVITSGTHLVPPMLFSETHDPIPSGIYSASLCSKSHIPIDGHGRRGGKHEARL